MNTQLLCTFCHIDDLDKTIENIVRVYDIAFDTIYVLESIESPDTLCCTYNVNNDAEKSGDVPPATISLHRKKSTNTLYTINALNLLISELNNGFVDKGFKVPWDDFKNTILVTAYGKLKKINTKLHKIVNLKETEA